MAHIIGQVDFALGVCQVKKIPKIREKLRSGWVGHVPARILFFLGGRGNFVVFLCFFGFFFVVHVSKKNEKKMDRGVCGLGLANPTFTLIFLIFNDNTPYSYQMITRVLYRAQYHRQHCTLQAFVQFFIYIHASSARFSIVRFKSYGHFSCLGVEIACRVTPLEDASEH